MQPVSIVNDYRRAFSEVQPFDRLHDSQSGSMFRSVLLPPSTEGISGQTLVARGNCRLHIVPRRAARRIGERSPESAREGSMNFLKVFECVYLAPNTLVIPLAA